MRGVSPVLRRGVALLVLAVLVAPMALGNDGVPAGPPPDPQARIGVPGGIAAEVDPSPNAQIGVPGGAPGADAPHQARLSVPGGIAAEDDPPTTWELFLVWLQARLGVPIG